MGGGGRNALNFVVSTGSFQLRGQKVNEIGVMKGTNRRLFCFGLGVGGCREGEWCEDWEEESRESQKEGGKLHVH